MNVDKNGYEKQGCEVLDELWKVALECNVDQPGFSGSVDRVVGFIQCRNVRDFMVMSTLKCWSERNQNKKNKNKKNTEDTDFDYLPPIILSDNETQYSKTNEKKKKTN
jgi:hypothetical protein